MEPKSIIYNQTPYQYVIKRTFSDADYPVLMYQVYCSQLSDIALKVLTFFMLHEEGTTIQITKVEIGKRINCAATTVTKAMKELERLGVLAQVGEYQFEIR